MVTPLTNKLSYFNDLAVKMGIILPSDLLTPQYTSKANTNIRYLRFHYLEDEIYNEVRKRTYHIAKFRADGPEKQHLIDLIALTGDDKDMFEPFYQTVALELLEVFTPFTRNINPAYMDRVVSGIKLFAAGTYKKDDLVSVSDSVWKCNVTTSVQTETFVATDFVIQPDIIYTDDKLIFFVEAYEWMNLNSTPITDKMVFEAIVIGIMANWFMFAFPEEAKNYIPMYQAKLIQVTGALNATGKWQRKYVY